MNLGEEKFLYLGIQNTVFIGHYHIKINNYGFDQNSYIVYLFHHGKLID